MLASGGLPSLEPEDLPEPRSIPQDCDLLDRAGRRFSLTTWEFPGETPLSSLTAARAVVFFLQASSRLGRRDGCGAAPVPAHLAWLNDPPCGPMLPNTEDGMATCLRIERPNRATVNPSTLCP